MATHAVGRNVDRKEGADKLTGRAVYIDDMTVPGMIYGATVRSTVPHARLVEVERDPAFDWSGFVILSARDIAALGGRNLVALIVDDQPILADERVRHQAEPVLLLAHPDRARLADAVRHVRLHYAPEPAVLELASATQVLKQVTIDKGDVARALASAPIVVEGSYHTAAQEQLYIECNGVIAVPEVARADGSVDKSGITVYGSLQCPYYVVHALEVALGLPRDKVRVIQTTTGGGFGGKEEYPSLLAAHAALLARRAGVPVKMVYERHEDLIATTKRHPSLVHHKTGVDKDGRLLAMQVDVRLDGGAYTTLSPVVLSRACIHAAGPYRCDDVRIEGRALMTNTPPNGAFRGFGAPQTLFAVEVHMDAIAARLGLDPIALRRRNLLTVGDSTATQQTLHESVSAVEVLDRALALHDERAKTKKKRAKPADDGRWRGRGVAVFLHGSGFTGAGEIKLAAKAGLALTDDGRVRVLVASTEIGQGTRTMLAQIVADTLHLPYGWIETADPDTREVPDSGPTVASRTCMIVGQILARAADKLAAELGAYATPDEFRRLARRRLKRGGPLSIIEEYARPSEMQWDDERYRGDAYGAYAWGCNVADVEIDPLTYQVRCTRITAVLDIGRAIHPILAEGQIEGGTLQGVGWALYEDVVMREGKMQNAQLTNYIIPTTLDTPEIAVGIVENPYRHGPFGAKGVGEAPIDGPAAAIVNAVNHALGERARRLDAIPVTPERVLAAITAKGAK